MNDEFNPYQVVARTIEPPSRSEPAPIEYEPAGNVLRLCNYLIDGVMAGLLQFFFQIVIGFRVIAHDPLKGFFVSALALLVYYVVMEGAFGTTLGKLVTGTRLLTEDGERPGLGTVVGRSLARLIPFEPFSILFSGEERTAWHDRLSGTRVVKKI